MAVYRNSEYATVVNLSLASANASRVFLDSVPEINMISLSRLIVGGAAILALISRNHIRVRFGAIINRPFVRIILRVWFISYVIFAKQNIPEDTIPWAIIISSAPIIPQFVSDITPVIRIPICPTEE